MQWERGGRRVSARTSEREEDMEERREREEEGRKGRGYCIHLLQGVLSKMSTPRMSTSKMSTPKILHIFV